MPIEVDVNVKHQRGSTSTQLPIAETYEPVVVEMQSPNAITLDGMQKYIAEACIYCSSTDCLSDEHAIPFAWGGNLIIINGSCEECRKKTSAFENLALNDGSMRNVRKIRAIQSRTDHSSADETLNVRLSNAAGEFTKTLAIADVPIVLGLFQFVPPSLLTKTGEDKVVPEGFLPAVFGPDLEEFLRSHGATAMHSEEVRKNPLAFASTICKIAYCYAWVCGILEFVKNSRDFVRAFMDDPEKLGRFFGTKPPPLERYNGALFRLGFRWEQDNWLVAEVQLFPDTPGPTYLAIVGESSPGDWERIKMQLESRR